MNDPTPNNPPDLGGTFTFPGTSLSVNRMGYGAMRLSGEGLWGPPDDSQAARAVLREAVAAGVNHIDTADFYGGNGEVNALIRGALHPYPADLVLVTKVGFLRTGPKTFVAANAPHELREAVHANLRHLGLDALDVVNLRLGGVGAGSEGGPREGSIEEPMSAMLDLRRQGLVRNVGLSNVTAAQVAQGLEMGPIACVQNRYNLAHRDDDALVDDLARQGIAYVPFFPLGGFSPLQSTALEEVAGSLGASAMQVALAWLLRRSPNVLLIPGTSSVDHLRENVKAASLVLPSGAAGKLDGIAEGSGG